MRFGSLFSGIGGLDLGLERAGLEVAWQVEIDDWCRRVLSRHWPDVPKFGDVKGLTGDELGAVDLICGGFPCQPVSVAGKGLAQADERWLWPEFARILRLLRPRFVLVENVPGLLAPVALKDDAGQIVGYTGAPIEEVLGDLAALGFDAEWDCIPAAAVGAPHLRYRVFVVAHAKRPERGSVTEGRDEPNRDDAGREEAASGARAAGEERRARIVADSDGGRREVERESQPAGEQSSSRGLAYGRGADGRLKDSAPLADSDGAAGRSTRGSGEAIFGPQTLERLRRRSGCLGENWTAEPDVGRVAYGIPSRVDRLRGLGNAVVPQVAEWIGRRIMEVAS